MSSPFRSDSLAADFDLELRRLALIRSVQRGRLALAIIGCIGTGAMLTAAVFSHATPHPPGLKLPSTFVRLLIGLGCIALITFIPRWRMASGRAPTQASGWRIERHIVRLIALFPFVSLLLLPEFRLTSSALMSAIGFPLEGVGVAPFLLALAAHLVACLLLPLRVGEAVIPILPFSLVTVVAILIVDPVDVRVNNALLAFSILLGTAVPGALVCLFRELRFRRASLANAVRDRYLELREDLDVARRIHDRLLPEPIDDALFTVRFAYEPMREIGGDLLVLHRSRNGAVHIVVLDVTGHGIAAALLVNRLHGELLRITGSDDDPAPERVLTLLNDYLLLTTSRDSMYATAAIVRLDPNSGSLRYASAAHPDLLVRSPDGRVHRLPSTACVLGALPGDCFEAAAETAPFGSDDRLLLYTDGLTETRSPSGAMWDIEGVAQRLGEPECQTPESFLAALRAHRDTSPQDDCIIVMAQRSVKETHHA
ncbi:MAG: serine/threonine-protein phosphatase [Phycisphaerae bacterium]|jgi:hypothetical protein|nr:serine/threonine-protein phosphatase [Phycisphaerae bacterium]